MLVKHTHFFVTKMRTPRLNNINLKPMIRLYTLLSALFLLVACSQKENVTADVRKEDGSVSSQVPPVPDQVMDKGKREKNADMPTTRTFTSRKQSPLTLAAFYKELSLTPDSFTIDAERDTFITGSKGTLIYLPALSFQDNSGGIIRNKITFILKECYDYPDMVAENLTTLTNGAQLESAGMIYTAAHKGNDTLVLRQGHEIGIGFTGVNRNLDFDLYYAQKDGNNELNWELDQEACKEIPVFDLSGGKYTAIYSDFFLDHYRLPKEDMLALNGSKLSFSSSFDESGNMIGYSLAVNNNKLTNKASNEFLYLMQHYKERFPNVNFSGQGVSFVFNVADGKHRISGINKELNKLMSGNIYFARRLGWTNCDRIPLFKPIGALVELAENKILERKEQRLKENACKLVIENDQIDENTDVKILYKGMRSVLKPITGQGISSIAGIPDGQEVYVLATKCTAEKILFCKEKVRVSKGVGPVKIDLKQFETIEDVKKEIKELTYL